ncbi:MAG: efflux RND transporter periplasmic adaptor subunit [Chloroflexota bacterium]
MYTVTRGTIEQQVKALGRVAAEEEAIMYFRQAGRLLHMYADTDQKVKKGDLLAELDTGTLPSQVAVAQAQAQIAQLKVDQAMGKDTSSGGDSAAVTSARAALAKAEADNAKAQDALDNLLEGPTTADVQTAQAAIAAAQTQLQKDQTALTQLQTPPTADQLTILRADLDKKQAALQQAQAAYDKVKLDPNVGALPQSAALQQATTDYNASKATFDQATAPPKPEDVANAQKQVQVDQSSVQATQSKLAVLQQGATAAQLDAAKQTVASTKSGIDLARVNLQQALGAASGKSIDVQIAQKQADLAKLQLQTLQDQLDQAQLRAPFDGVVTEVDNQDGDAIQSYTPVLTVSNPATLEIAVELQPTDLTQVALGQVATIVLSSFPKTTLTGKVIRMPAVATSNQPQLPATLRTVRINLPTPPGKINLGDLANVTIDVQKKENVLLLPTTAIQTFGGKRFVRLAGGNGEHQEVDIEVGINDDTNTEITKGLTAGQKVIAP